MNRQQKEAVVAEFKDMLNSSDAAFLVQYKGLNVQDMISLRRALRETGGKLKVTKARLMKIAAEGIEGIDPFKEQFKEQIGLVFAEGDVSAVAKQVVTFAKDHKALQVVSGFYESKVLSRDEVEFFASLPSRDVLLSQLARALQGPIAGFARVLNAPIEGLARALNQVAKKKEGGEA